ncbi:MAG: hypothetical protein MZU97_10325 [Bacillus subtilis]|nr:hypothetical protein [Bacillus subtilis]
MSAAVHRCLRASCYILEDTYRPGRLLQRLGRDDLRIRSQAGVPSRRSTSGYVAKIFTEQKGDRLLRLRKPLRAGTRVALHHRWSAWLFMIVRLLHEGTGRPRLQTAIPFGRDADLSSRSSAYVFSGHDRLALHPLDQHDSARSRR